MFAQKLVNSFGGWVQDFSAVPGMLFPVVKRMGLWSFPIKPLQGRRSSFTLLNLSRLLFNSPIHTRLPMQETPAQSLGRENPLEEEMATHSSILAWRIPWTEEPIQLQSMGSQRVGQVLVTEHKHTHTL